MKNKIGAVFICSTACMQLVFGGVSLRVGISQNPPLKYTDSTGAHTGLFVELLKETARRQGWKLQWRAGTFTQCMEWLEQGQIDVIPNIGYSSERARKFHFCKENVISTWAQVYCRPESSIGSIADLHGKTVAVQKKDVFVNDPKDGFRRIISHTGIQCRLQEVSTYDDVFKLVESNAVDAGIVNRVVGDLNGPAFRVKKTGVIFYPVGLRFAVSRQAHSETFVAAALDSTIAAWKEQPASPYFKLLDRFYPVEKARTISRKKIIAAFFQMYFPWLIAVGASLCFIIAVSACNIVLNRRLRKKNQMLEKQLREIQTLQGLIPICYKCRKVRDDKGYWHSVERYVAKLSGARFTHGICPECMEKHFPQEVNDAVRV